MKLKQTAALALLIFSTPALAEKTQAASVEAGKVQGSEPAEASNWTEAKSGMKFSWVPSGCFKMGSKNKKAEKNEGPVHEVCLKGFWMGQYEVSQEEYQKVMGSNPSKFANPKNPVENVSWEDTQRFAEKLSSSAGVQFSLPSEAQWEYACRAGREGESYCGTGGTIGKLIWSKRRGVKQITPVGKFAPNKWGMYDMSGNVWEWVTDTYHLSYDGAPADGSAWLKEGKDTRVVRGGSNFDGLRYDRATSRTSIVPTYKGNDGGFRLVRTQP